MKCPTCGYQNSPTRQQCVHCSASLLPVAAGGSNTTPEWRREVAEKVRAYGERKKMLTTPPRPLKEPSIPEENVTQDPPALEQQAGPILLPTPKPIKPVVPILQPEAEQAHIDIVKQDLLCLEFMESPAESDQVRSYLGRRTVALLIDTAILAALQLVLLALISRIVDVEILSLALSAWPICVSVFLGWHCLYYLYFYRTSRQTPGQVFVALELRDPGSSEISVSKILIRWLSMILLHFLNLTPLLWKQKWLLLDRLSRTQIRSVR